MTERFVQERKKNENFRDFINRIGKKEIRNMFEDLVAVPSHEKDSSYYSDWGDPREFTIQDMGVGECAGEVVSKVEFGLSSSERQVFEAQIQLDERNPDKASDMAYRAMLAAARSLVQTQFEDISEEPQQVVQEFRARFFDTKLFFDTYAAGKFAQYFFRAHENLGERSEPQTLKVQMVQPTQDAAHHRVEEAQLFIEAAYRCYGRMTKTS